MLALWQGVTVADSVTHQTRHRLAQGRRRDGARRQRDLTPVQAVLRGTAMFIVIWQALTLAPDARFWAWTQSSPALSVLVIAAWATWAALVLSTWGPWRSGRRRHRIEQADAWIVLILSIGMLFAGSAQLDDGWIAAATLVNLAVGLISLAYPLKHAFWIVVGALIVEAIGIQRDAAASATEYPAVWLYTVYAAAIAAAVMGTRRGLIVAARTAQLVQEDAIRADAQARALQEIQRVVMTQARLLHESVLNTLTAIARGLLPADREQLRTQCSRAVDVLESLADLSAESGGEIRLLDSIEPQVQALREAGVRVDVAHVVGAPPPQEVARAFVASTREALSNALRHAQATAVTVRTQRDGRDWELVVEDDGIGFDTQAPTTGFGLRSVIEREMPSVGGFAEIASTPGAGTTVTLHWRTPRRSMDSPANWLDAGRTAMAVSVLVAFHVFTLASLIVSLGDYRTPAWAVAAFGLSLACVALIFATGRRGIMPAWAVVTVAVAGPAIYFLQTAAVGNREVTGWSDWASEAILSLMFAITGLGAWWAGAVAVGAWLLAQGDVLTELLSPGTAVIVAGVFFARSLRANERAVYAAEQDAAAQMARSQAERESVRHLSARYQGLAESGAATLLRGIVDGLVDPADPTTQRQCALEERFIRAIMRLDPESSDVQGTAMRLAVETHRRGRMMTIDLGEGLTLSPAKIAHLHEVESSAMGALDLLDAEEPVRLTLRQEGETVVMRLVAQLASGVEAASLPGMRGLIVDPTDGTVLWELVDA